MYLKKHGLACSKHFCRQVVNTLIGLTIAASLTGCAIKHHDAILFVTNTQVGAKVGVDATQIPEIQVGYNRQEAALVPLHKAGTASGAVSPNTPTLSGLLGEVDDLMKAIHTGGTANWATSKSVQVPQAAELLQTAIQIEKGSKLEPSFLLAKTQNDVNALAGLANFDANKIAIIRSQLKVELGKPASIAEFNGLMKYVGDNQAGGKKDAYSVLGTFRGGGKATTTSGVGPTAEGSGKIAQYFATGVAAQILAEQGGAALVNPKAAPTAALNPANKANIDMQKQKNEIGKKYSKISAQVAAGGGGAVAATAQKNDFEAIITSTTKKNVPTFILEGTPEDTTVVYEALKHQKLLP